MTFVGLDESFGRLAVRGFGGQKRRVAALPASSPWSQVLVLDESRRPD